MAAGLGLVGVAADGEYGAEVIIAAADKDQARIVFGIARDMVAMAPPRLQKVLKVYRNAIVGKNGGVMKAISSEAFTKHGLNPSMVIFDELHAQKDRELYTVLRTAQGARKQPLFIMITTAGHDRHSVCWEQHEYAIKVRDGLIDDPAFLPVIYAAEEDDDWTSPAVWRKANPSLGVTVDESFLASECRRAQEQPAYENDFRQLYLCQWTEQAQRWLPLKAWDACGDVEVDPESLIGRRCFGGLDLGLSDDLSALTLLFPMDDGSLHVLCYCWVPEDRLRTRSRKDRADYPTWARNGHLEVTEGEVADFDRIQADIERLVGKYQIVQLGYDQRFAAQLAINLDARGVPMVRINQTIPSLTGACRQLERLMISKRLQHGGHPVLRWCAANVALKTDHDGGMMPSKSRSTGRIDLVAALVMAIDRWQSTVDDSRAGELNYAILDGDRVYEGAELDDYEPDDFLDGYRPTGGLDW